MAALRPAARRRRRRRHGTQPLRDRGRPVPRPPPSIEAEQLELVALICDEVSIPVAVKISPYYTSVAAFALGSPGRRRPRDRHVQPLLPTRPQPRHARRRTAHLAQHAGRAPPAAAVDRHRPRLPLDLDRRVDRRPHRHRRRQAAARRRRRRDDDLGSAPPRAGPRRRHHRRAARVDAQAPLQQPRRDTRAASVERRPPTPPPTNVPTTSAIVTSYTSRFIGATPPTNRRT